MHRLINITVLTVALIPGMAFFNALAQTQAPALDEKTRVAIEALNRLEGINLEENPALKTAVTNLLEATRGTPDFVNLINKFQLSGYTQDLIDHATRHPKEESGVQAMALILKSPKASQALPQALLNTNQVQAANIALALGNTRSPKAVPFLRQSLTNEAIHVSVRKQSVRSMALSRPGAQSVLAMAREGNLPQDLSFTASTELASVRWQEIKIAAAKILPPPQANNAQPLPPLAELLKQKGNPARGSAIFASEGPNCATCHQVKGKGVNVGPDLSEIGSKLGKDALYEAILDPSAGVSFGYEAHELELDSGEEAYGLIVSETKEEIAIKDTQGIVTRHKKSEIISRRQMTLSIMPSGLQLTMSTQDLVDLIEFLATLKSPSKQ